MRAVADTNTVAEREESIGARISQLRKDKGMTQKELAERLEVSQPVVSDYENDVIRLPADIVGEIAQILEVTSDELLGLKRESRSTAASRTAAYRGGCKRSMRYLSVIRKRCFVPSMPLFPRQLEVGESP